MVAEKSLFKVKDLSLADWGRKEIKLAEAEMPGLMALRGIWRQEAFEGCPHRRLPSHDDSNRRSY